MGKGGGGSSNALNVDPALRSQFDSQSRYMDEMAFRNEAQRNAQYGAFERAGAQIYGNTPWYEQQVGSAANTITDLARQNIGLANQRQDRELAQLAPFLSTGGDVRNLGNLAAADNRAILAPQMGAAGNVAQMGNNALAPQIDYAMRQYGLSNLYGDQQNLSPQQQAGWQTLGASQALGGQLQPLRGQALDTLSQVAQGRISPQIQQLFTDAGGARERDLLELQTQNARNQLMESTGSAGGSLDRNLAALEAQRVYGLGEQEARRTNAQRQLAQQLFGTATEQGLTSPQQQAALAGQAAGIFGSAEQQRQAGLTGALGAVETAAARELAGRSFQQQSQVQSQQLAQQLAQQYLAGANFQQQSHVQGQQLAQQMGAQLGQGADALRLAAPEQLGQATALYNQQLLAPSIAPSVLGQGRVESPASYLSPVLSGQVGLMGGNMSAASAAQQAQSAQQASNAQAAGSLIATVGTAALLAFT